ncbi:hypothetical protein CEXT_608421 [Caerostris extrusa]|uniref:Uncharacterized protein n=1 Tax=Caerostris extrusa TaxID=172846 RepID=A0AAV4TCK7_CAEEX|nr:hypothetical protein CEXT_608421 [Caerostris extrusa]
MYINWLVYSEREEIIVTKGLEICGTRRLELNSAELMPGMSCVISRPIPQEIASKSERFCLVLATACTTVPEQMNRIAVKSSALQGIETWLMTLTQERIIVVDQGCLNLIIVKSLLPKKSLQ